MGKIRRESFHSAGGALPSSGKLQSRRWFYLELASRCALACWSVGGPPVRERGCDRVRVVEVEGQIRQIGRKLLITSGVTVTLAASKYLHTQRDQRL